MGEGLERDGRGIGEGYITDIGGFGIATPLGLFRCFRRQRYGGFLYLQKNDPKLAKFVEMGHFGVWCKKSQFGQWSISGRFARLAFLA